MFELRDALGWVDGARLIGDPSTRIDGVSTDTRAIRRGDLFVALRGERFDAHAFVGDARAAGAAALVVERWTADCAAAALQVPDSRRALGQIALGWRARHALPLIAVTGSNGKTTVKEMIAAVLAEFYGETAHLATRGNLNNDVGVPLTLLRLSEMHRAAVIELGTNRPGEIGLLARMALPTVALVNNAQREHQEFLHSVEGSARENGAAIAALPPDGVAVFPGADACAPLWRELAGARRRIEFGREPRFDVSAPADAMPAGFELRVGGARVAVALQIDGAHNVDNALAAAACCDAIGVPAAAIARGLARFEPVAGRLRRFAAGGAAVIDDSYNANPDSVRAAIDVLAQARAPRLLVLGDMGEVGEQGPQFHAEVGGYARDRGVERLLAFGPQSRRTVAAFGDGGEHFDDVDALTARVRELCCAGATVLVKGSRSMRMDRVVQSLTGGGGDAH